MSRPFGRLVLFVAVRLLPAVGWADAPKPRLDADGDPLPDGALARVGSRRLRHTDSAIIVAFAPDGKALASAGNDGLVRLWETATGREIRRFKGHEGNVDGLAFSSDGKALLSTGTDGLARLWETATGKERVVLRGHNGAVNAAAFSPDGKTAATKGTDAIARLWDLATGKELHQVPVASDAGTSNLAFSPDGKLLAVVGRDTNVHLLDTADYKEVRGCTAPRAVVNSLDFSHDGKLLAAACDNSLVQVWDVATGKGLRQLRGHEGAVASVRFSPDRKTLATGGIDGTVRVWDAETGNELHRCTGHTATVSEVSFSPDGKVLASASWDHTVKLWDPATGKELPQSDRAAPVACAALSADGKLLVTGHQGKGLRLWDPATGKPLQRAVEFDGPVTALTVSLDGKLIAAGNRAGGFGVWEADTGLKRFTFEQRGKRFLPGGVAVGVLTFTPDGRGLAVIRNEVGASAGLYDTTSGRRLRELVPEARNDDTSSTVHYPPHALVFAPDGRTFITTSLTDGVRLYDADGKAGHRLIEGREVAFLGIALSPDGRSLATAAVGGKVRLWEVATGGERRAFGPDQERASAVAFSADGKLLAGSGTGGVVRVWQSATGRELHSFRGHDSELSALTFAADGKLLSVSHDGTVLVWDTSGLKSGAAGRPGKLDPDAAWASLSGGDAAGAYEAIARLEASPEEAVGLLRERLKPAEAADAKRIDGLIARLDADDFAEREKATRELGKLGVQAQGALRKAAKAPPSAEVARRIADLLQKIEGGNQSGEALRQTRALEVLEAVGTPQAKDLLGELAKGAPDVPLTQEAKASLERLVQRRATR